MNKKDFFYKLPSEQIASYPSAVRSESRLMRLDKLGSVSHHIFHDILNWLDPGDLLIFNNTRVMPARLQGQKNTGGLVELLVERITDTHTALSHIRRSKGLKTGDQLSLSQNITARVIQKIDALWELSFSEPVFEVLEAIGEIPLPPYMNRLAEDLDKDRYQTVYADPIGAVAAPTAGLHFDEQLLSQLKQKGINTAHITLHVGAGTFQSVRTENITEHKMHAEWVSVGRDVCDAIQKAKCSGKRVVAVGTTTLRSLESAAQKTGSVEPFEGDTSIFIYPGYVFHSADILITNFHLPESTLMMLVSAFSGHASIMSAYDIAVKNNYRFFSYGDAMWLDRP